MTNDKLAATFHGADTDPTPEQALRAHVADLLTDVDHPQTCIPAACNCLIGRLNWAINAEQITTDPTKAAIETVARSVTEQMLGDAGQEISDLWDDYPEIGESDWQAVVWLVIWRARNGKPDEATFREAYEHLKGRAEATQDGAA